RPAHAAATRPLRRVCRAEPTLFGPMSAGDHLIFAARTVGVPVSDAVARFERYGGAEWLDHSVDSLSTGNTRKLWLTMCTLGQAALIVLDEPFSGLDRAGAELLDDDIRRWSRQAIVVLVSHDHSRAPTPRWTLVLPNAGSTQAATIREHH
ncbi:MAG: hypothetical protein ACTJHU_08430, partial [Mycetocola sp.]